jgi:hypothetical protein
VASKQTRRSISVRGTTYDNLRRYCQENSISMSEVVEQQLARLLEGREPATVVAAPRASIEPVVPVTSVKSVGRPAPVAYEQVVAPRVARASAGGGGSAQAEPDDYRTIRF